MRFESTKDIENEIAEQERTLAEQRDLLAEAEEKDDENLSVMKENVRWTQAIIDGLKTIRI